MTTFASALAREIWETRYRFVSTDGVAEPSIDATWARIARALAAAEPRERAQWTRRFEDVLAEFKFLPGGRIIAGAGTGRRVTLFNCFVMGTLADSLEGIFESLRECALTMQQGGGIGVDFSPLRPAGSRTDATGAVASGPVSFMHMWDSMCATVTSVGARRGAMMGTLACDHPDIEAFVAAKRNAGSLTHFNLSVLVSDAFMTAVDAGADWTLSFARARVERRVNARALWDAIVRHAYAGAEPGVLFIDRIRDDDNLNYAETISATNPCGEIPLPPYGACDLGSFNLTRFVREPFTERATLDLAALADCVPAAVRMLDNVYDVSGFPLARQADAARQSRRLGIGITGLADTLIMLGHAYGSDAARSVAADAMRTIRDAAYAASVELGREKGAFARYDRDRYAAARFVSRLPAELRAAISRHGIRNSHLTAIAPAGTISLLAGNVSSGLEPVFALSYERRVRQPSGAIVGVPVDCYALARWRELRGDAPLAPSFVSAADIGPDAQLAMQAALQPYVDNAISKTTNVRADLPFDEFAAIYRRAYDIGLKGCTVFRPNAVTGAILSGPEPRCERCDPLDETAACAA
jgi:ribonucleoside-diphosphate reductase alpha chain